MSESGLLADVADAVALRQQVDWERCAARAQPAERPALGHLRTIAGICRAGDRGPAGPEGSTRDGGQGSRLVRRAIGALVAVALLQSVVGLTTGVGLLPTATQGMLASIVGPAAVPAVSATGFLPVAEMASAAALFRILPHVLYPVCGLLLLIGGRHDRRAGLLGAVLVLLGAFWAQPVVGGLGVGLYPELFLPAVLWMFVREFPRVRRRTRIDDAAAGMAVVAALVGGGLQVANLPPVQALSPSLAVFARDVPGVYVAPAFFGPHCVLVLAALAALLLRVRGVAGGERRGARLFVGGIVAALAPHAEGVVEVVAPGTVTVAAANWVSVLGSASTVAVPCLTMYAAIALRVLDVRTTVRVSARRLLTRGGLALFIAGPLAALVAVAVGRADWRLTDVLADPLAQGCLVCAVAGATAAMFRERVLAVLDSWVTPQTGDQRLALAAAGADLGQVREVAAVAGVVARAARQGADLPGTLLVAAEASSLGARRFAAPVGSIAPLPRMSAIVQALEDLHIPLQVNPGARGGVFDLLPPDEAAWVTANAAAIVVRIGGAGAATEGVLVAGPRADGGRLRPVDLGFLEALAATAGLGLARLRLQDAPVGRAEPPPARVCEGCGRLVAEDDAGAGCDACGGEWAQAPVPVLLADKFLLDRRVGTGGMGTVFRAWDIGLDRLVAVKTLDAASSARLARLKPEARAMAAPTHPGIAQVHGLEAWRGRPLLVMEYLDGGTLAARVTVGPLPPAEAVRVAVAAAEALRALHAAGYRHGDVKPSNIGFTSDGTVKLIDFGLSVPTADRRAARGGTVAYLSPEALGGEPASAADDVWALSVMLYEMAAGRRPFGGETVDDVADGIRRRSPGPLPASGGGDLRAAVLAFAGRMLTAPLRERPATADEFVAALRACVAVSADPVVPRGQAGRIAEAGAGVQERGT